MNKESEKSFRSKTCRIKNMCLDDVLTFYCTVFVPYLVILLISSVAVIRQPVSTCSIARANKNDPEKCRGGSDQVLHPWCRPSLKVVIQAVDGCFSRESSCSAHFDRLNDLNSETRVLRQEDLGCPECFFGLDLPRKV